VLDLEHHALVGLVYAVERLGDQAVQTRALELLEPLPGHVDVPGRRRHVDRRARLLQRAFEPGSAFGERASRVVVVTLGQQVEPDEVRGRRLREHVAPALGRVDPLLERLEVQPALGRHDDLAVDHRALGERRP
jgi:hypothetical protein